MKTFKFVLCFLLCASIAHAGPFFSGGVGGGGTSIVYNTVANLPAAPSAGDLAGVTDGSTASDCTVGTGSTYNLCQ